MNDKRTPFILRPFVVCLLLAAALAVFALAFRSSEQADKYKSEIGAEMARLQESRAYYEGRIARREPPAVRTGEVVLPPLPEIPAEIQTVPKSLVVPDYAEIVPPAGEPLWKKNAVAYTPTPSKAKIVIIIDDMGMGRKHTKEAMTLTAPVTFAWLPYASNIQPLIDEARAAGHEAIVHVPMEPGSNTIDPGPTVLKTSMTSDEVAAMLDKNLSALTGYVGFNNHMGSKLTQDAAAMQLVMSEAAKRGVLFVDSRTAPNSIAGQVAAAIGVPTANRDVFIDHFEDIHSVRAALEQMEKVASRQGYAIGIGHPKPNTLAGLREWIPTLADKGFELAPVSAVVRTSEPAAGDAPSRDVAGPVQPPVSVPAPY